MARLRIATFTLATALSSYAQPLTLSRRCVPRVVVIAPPGGSWSTRSGRCTSRSWVITPSVAVKTNSSTMPTPSSNAATVYRIAGEQLVHPVAGGGVDPEVVVGAGARHVPDEHDLCIGGRDRRTGRRRCPRRSRVRRTPGRRCRRWPRVRNVRHPANSPDGSLASTHGKSAVQVEREPACPRPSLPVRTGTWPSSRLRAPVRVRARDRARPSLPRPAGRRGPARRR